MCKIKHETHADHIMMTEEGGEWRPTHNNRKDGQKTKGSETLRCVLYRMSKTSGVIERQQI